MQGYWKTYKKEINPSPTRYFKQSQKYAKVICIAFLALLNLKLFSQNTYKKKWSSDDLILFLKLDFTSNILLMSQF